MKRSRAFLSGFTRFCLRHLTDEHMRETILEDMEARYAFNIERKGSFLSGMIWLGKLIIILTAFVVNSCFGRMILFKNYFKITLRHITKNKGYSILNISGLAVGMACTILILLWVKDEISFDRFHKNADRIYRVVCSTSDDGAPTNANGSFGVGLALKREFPEVIETVRIRKMGQSVKRYVGYQDKKFYESRFFFSEPALLTVFDFPLVKGDSASALDEPGTMVVTEETAEKYFGKENPMGKIIEADPYNNGELMFFRITGVAGNIPANSHLHFDFLASYSSQREETSSLSGFYQHFTYVFLNAPSSAESLNNKLLDFLKRNWREDPWYTISLQPLTDIRLHSRLKSEIESTGNILYVYIFTAVALFVLIIACINFMNLTTACSLNRAREVGIRKVVGARRDQLVQQFLGESLWLSLVSISAAILFVLITLPMFNRLTGKSLTLFSLTDPGFLLGTAALILAVGFLSGSYPAFFLAAFQPMNSLKSRTTHSSSGNLVRKGLVIFQFALSIGIIFSTLIAQKQMAYIRSHNLGYDRDQILIIPLNKDLRRNYQGFRDELLKNPGIENTTTSSLVPTRGSFHYSFRFEGREENLSQAIYLVDREFIDTYGMTLLAGNRIQLSTSEAGPWEFLVSELTTREAGYSSPEEAIGKSVSLEDDRGHIVGVVNDINIYSLRQQPYSISYLIAPIESHNYLSLRIVPRNISETIGFLGKTWQAMIPNYPLDYFFLDDSFKQMHLSDKKMSQIFSIFSFLAIFVAGMGLFGLAAHTAQQKRKEIGIRKILGASSSSIYRLLSGRFLKWVALANIFAWPVGYYAMHKWLQNFVYQTRIGWEMFIVSGAAALAISFLTVSLQAYRATRANPVDSLRHE